MNPYTRPWQTHLWSMTNVNGYARLGLCHNAKAHTDIHVCGDVAGKTSASLRQEENSPADGAIIEAFACRCNVDTIVRQQGNIVGQHPTMLPVNDLGKELNKTFQFRIHLVDQRVVIGAQGVTGRQT